MDYFAALPTWIDKDAWQGFISMRKSIKKPLTKRGMILAINKLETLLKQGHDPNKVLDQSTFYSWQGLFPVKEDGNGLQKSGSGGNGSRPEPKSFHQRDVEEAERVKQAVRTRLGISGGSTRLGSKSDTSKTDGRKQIGSADKVINVSKVEIIKAD